MRVCIDLDGVICELRRGNESYRELKAVPGAVQKLRELKSHGHYIIIYTARRMRTSGGNPGKAVAEVGHATLQWLADNQVPYDEIFFGKPWADVYIDDNAVRFTSWDEVAADGSNLPQSREMQLLSENP